MRQALKGKRILVTRASNQQDAFLRQIKTNGGEAISLPLIQLNEIQDKTLIHQAFEHLDTIDWLVFTSENAVNFFFQEALEYGVKFYFFPNLKIATVGEKTKMALELLGYRTNFVPIQFRAEVLAENMDEVKGKRILIPRSDIASNEYLDVFIKRGAEVLPLVVYSNETLSYSASDIKEKLIFPLDYITFTSGSIVKAFHELQSALNWTLDKEELICIGPETAKVAKQLGYANLKIAKPFTVEGMLECMIQNEVHV